MDPKNQRGAIGPIVGVIIILGVILAGGIYFYTTIKSNQSANVPPPAPTTSEVMPVDENATLDTTAKLSAQSTSTDPSTIGSDLNSVDANAVSNVGADF